MLIEDPANLEVLKQAPETEELWLRHFHRITSLEPLKALTKLRKLDLRTIPSWDEGGRNLVVDTFEPLAGLSHLEHINMIGVIPRTDRLEPLSRIPSLKHVSFSSNGSFYQLEDYATLSAALPGARDTLKPVRPFMRCEKCRSYLTLRLNGSYPRQRKSACPSCDRKALVAHLERWNSLGGMPQYTGLENLAPKALADLFGAHYSPLPYERC